MRARPWIIACLLTIFTSTVTSPGRADEETEDTDLPPLELLGFIADFSDNQEGWVDPQEIEGIFNLDGEEPDQENKQEQTDTKSARENDEESRD